MTRIVNRVPTLRTPQPYRPLGVVGFGPAQLRALQHILLNAARNNMWTIPDDPLTVQREPFPEHAPEWENR